MRQADAKPRHLPQAKRLVTTRQKARRVVSPIKANKQGLQRPAANVTTAGLLSIGTDLLLKSAAPKPKW
ncbi:hypothetical protein AABB87_11480 [Roseateles sp. PN1]